jgi:hypothetical protein
MNANKGYPERSLASLTHKRSSSSSSNSSTRIVGLYKNIYSTTQRAASALIHTFACIVVKLAKYFSWPAEAAAHSDVFFLSTATVAELSSPTLPLKVTDVSMLKLTMITVRSESAVFMQMALQQRNNW